MSEVNWDLIEKLSRRFDALVGIATEERLQQMYDNFHLVSVVLDGRFEEYMREFVPIQPPADAKSADLAGARERLRQYNLPQFPQETVRSIAETAGLFFPERYSDEFGREKALTAGANVVMPNYTPLEYRVNYEIYPNKRCITEGPGLRDDCIRARILSVGRTVATSRGDAHSATRIRGRH